MATYSKYILMIGVPIAVVASIGVLWWQRKKKKPTLNVVGRVSDLIIYPVKSCKGIRVSEAKCFKEGMEYDRCWVIVDEKDVFITQRTHPQLALVVPEIEDNRYLCLNAPKMKTLKLDTTDTSGEVKKLRVKRMDGEGRYVGDEAAEWISNYLEMPGCKIYQLTKPRIILEDDKWGSVAQPGDTAAFGDFAPYLICSEASLDALNEELPSPVTMERFRANIIINGLEAWEEDKWSGKNIRVGDVEFRFLKDCGRCLFVTVDPDLGEKDGEEPLVTLRRIRLPEDRDPRQGQSPLFGVHVTPEGSAVGGSVKLGDSVTLVA
ncbi:mitochondrial amidoxime-reducing component 1-like [Porites lutea]|uniref:mitochondrial amidoxime-reducing component 1-like n=1 Tax=Porites lutea TaxID=51062 RepID=UPI003CC69CCF